MVSDALRCKLASDDRLAELAASGCPGAAAAVCERFREPLARYCGALTGHPEDARDATQAALERALRALAAGEAPRALRPWLYRIAHNAAMDVIRRRRPDQPLDGIEHLVADGPGEPAARERLTEVLGDLRALPERQRGALLLRELAGLDYDELAGALGTSSQAARQSVFEARAGLLAAQDGRATGCDSVRRTLSDGDRRRLRRREIRAHLQGCGGCRDFARGIRARRRALALLPVPWAATAAAGALSTGGVVAAPLGWTTAKGIAAVAAAVTATGSVATVERLQHDPAPRAPKAAAAPAPDRADAALAKATAPSAAVVRAARSATAAPTSAKAVRAVRRRSGAVVVESAAGAAASVRTERRRVVAREQEVARRKAELETPAATTTTTVAAPSAPARPATGSPGREAVRQAMREATRVAVQDAQQRTQQAADAARTAHQQALSQLPERLQQAITQTQESVRQSVDQTVTGITQALDGILAPTDPR
ncbi:RNA polymerase sigma factor [Conexibacter sp. SYSU D00693]|uniref:RNA polymerase sigma factor n=1 Tax=Conexibacter sp. SYSU D00693 TaxID=2812560 RepID=UPI00196BA154|nr:sigma-70 family RNA polymerase sigma factor [Conexibacter sp. SYSU D00693]